MAIRWTAEELEAMRLADEEIEREFRLTTAEVKETRLRDRDARDDRLDNRQRRVLESKRRYREENFETRSPVSDAVRLYRREHGLTQKALGRMIGRAQPTVSQWEKGDVPPEETLLALLPGWEDAKKGRPVRGVGQSGGLRVAGGGGKGHEPRKEYTMEQDKKQEQNIRPTDIVLHRPSGEHWVVCGVNMQTGMLIPCGYPFPTVDRIEDCELVEARYPEKGMPGEYVRALESVGYGTYAMGEWGAET